MNKFWIGLGLLCGVVLLVCGCSIEESSSVPTSEMYIVYQVRDNLDGTAQCTAEFFGDDEHLIHTEYLFLDDGDTVRCNGVRMYEDVEWDEIAYVAQIPYQSGDTVDIAFERRNEGPYTSYVVIPERFDILTPTDQQTVIKGTAIPVTWSALTTINSVMDIELEWATGSRFYSLYNPTSGNYTIPGADTVIRPGAGPVPAQLDLELVVEGFHSPDLQGVIWGIQRRSVDVVLRD